MCENSQDDSCGGVYMCLCYRLIGQTACCIMKIDSGESEERGAAVVAYVRRVWKRSGGAATVRDLLIQITVTRKRFMW